MLHKALPLHVSKKTLSRTQPHILLPALLCSVLMVSVMLLAQEKSIEAGADLAEAKTLYASVCASCHGLNAHGGERGPDLVGRPEVAQKTDTELTEILQAGRPSAGMPAFAALGAGKLTEMVAYLRALQGQIKQKSLPGNPSRGETLFSGKAKCVECHMVNGRGGFLASDLSSYAARQGADEIRAEILNPDKDLDPRRGMVEIVQRDATKLSGMVRSEDNFSLQMQTPDGTFHLLNKSEIGTETYTGKSGMPTNYGSTLSPTELNDIVSYLIQISGAEKRNKSNQDVEDHDE